MRADTETQEPAYNEPVRPARRAPIQPADLNPEGWDTEKWMAYVVRNATDKPFKRKSQDVYEKRFLWTLRRADEIIGGRRVGYAMRRQIMVDATDESFSYFPRPDPFEGGWTRPVPRNVVDSLAGGMKL